MAEASANAAAGAATTAMTIDQLRTVLFATEASSDKSKLNTFSYAGGDSSYSFGLLQIDVGTNHGNVQQFLKDNGFTQKQIDQLSQKGGLSGKDNSELDKQLQAIPQAKLDEFANGQLTDQVARVDRLVSGLKTSNSKVGDAIAKNPQLQLAIADYDNQFTITDLDYKKSNPKSLRSFLEGNEVTLQGGKIKVGDPITREDIQKYINATQYGQEHSKSVGNREQRLDSAISGLDLDAKQATGPKVGVPNSDAPKKITALTDSAHPGNALFRQAQTGMQAIDAKFSRTSDHQTDNAAGHLAVTAQRAGMTRIDAMELGGTSGDKIIAVQGQPGTAHSKVIAVPTVEALNTSLAQSSQAFNAVQQAPQPAVEQSQQVAQPAPAPAQPAMSR